MPSTSDLELSTAVCQHAFKDDSTVHITSDEHNLHPIMYAEIYRAVKGLIETSLQLCDNSLLLATVDKQRQSSGREGARINAPKDAGYCP